MVGLTLQRRVRIAGSTGSIGRQALEVIAENPDRFVVEGLAAHHNVELLAQQIEAYRPELVVVVDKDAAKKLQADPRVDASCEVRAGSSALRDFGASPDTVLNAVVGFAGLEVTLATLEAGGRCCLANKESLVAGGPLVFEALRQFGGALLPVDSEHGAIHQCLRSGRPNGDDSDLSPVRRILLTASGGPFYGLKYEEIAQATKDDALRHPTWQMGAKITVDSSTLVNKGLEVIEAHVLFGVSYDQIDVVVHPQSIFHSAVEFVDGSVIAQLNAPDMRLPIGYALGLPHRLSRPFGLLDWAQGMHLDFGPVDPVTFPALGLSYEAGRRGGTAPTWLNAANEVAVEAFLQDRVTWGEISSIIDEVLSLYNDEEATSVEVVFAADSSARAYALDVVKKIEGS